MPCDNIEPKEELEEVEQMIMSTDTGNNRPTTVNQMVLHVDAHSVNHPNYILCHVSCHAMDSMLIQTNE